MQSAFSFFGVRFERLSGNQTIPKVGNKTNPPFLRIQHSGYQCRLNPQRQRLKIWVEDFGISGGSPRLDKQRITASGQEISKPIITGIYPCSLWKSSNNAVFVDVLCAVSMADRLSRDKDLTPEGKTRSGRQARFLFLVLVFIFPPRYP